MTKLFYSFAFIALISSTLASAAERPNILILFTDDQGYADLACYGNTKNKTPGLNQLAKEGTRFTSFYTQTVCGPSRSALLTGRYPQLSKGWSMPAGEITWAELMQKAGYQTACVGKWDVSNRKAIIDRMPNAQGFDYFWGALGANDSGRITFHENNEPAGSSNDMGELTRLYTDKCIDYLENKRDKSKPFVLYLAHTMMHTIIDASPKFRGKSAGGLYGDVVEEFDYETGRLLDKLDELGLSDNTLVLYTSDNGPWNQPKYYERKKGHPPGSIFWGESGPLRNGKGSPYEGGYRAACIARWPGKIPAGKVSDSIWATIDFLPTFANLAGFKVPCDRVIHGMDQTDMLLGKTDKGRDSFYYENAGIRMGKWKYLQPKAKFYSYAREDDRKEVDELYNLDADIGERNNLAKKHPEIVNKLKAELEKHKAQKSKIAPNLSSSNISLPSNPLKGKIPLKAGDQFPFERSPIVAGKDLSISAILTSKKPDGCIVAQGGSLVGYSLYLRDGKVIFGVRVNSKLQELIADPIVTGKKVSISARLTKAGHRSLTVNGKTLEAKGPPLHPQPKMGLSAGHDQSINIGSYKDEKFEGKIEELVLEVK